MADLVETIARRTKVHLNPTPRQKAAGLRRNRSSCQWIDGTWIRQLAGMSASLSLPLWKVVLDIRLRRVRGIGSTVYEVPIEFDLRSTRPENEPVWTMFTTVAPSFLEWVPTETMLKQVLAEMVAREPIHFVSDEVHMPYVQRLLRGRDLREDFCQEDDAADDISFEFPTKLVLVPSSRTKALPATGSEFDERLRVPVVAEVRIGDKRPCIEDVSGNRWIKVLEDRYERDRLRRRGYYRDIEASELYQNLTSWINNPEQLNALMNDCGVELDVFDGYRKRPREDVEVRTKNEYSRQWYRCNIDTLTLCSWAGITPFGKHATDEILPVLKQMWQPVDHLGTPRPHSVVTVVTLTINRSHMTTTHWRPVDPSLTHTETRIPFTIDWVPYGTNPSDGTTFRMQIGGELVLHPECVNQQLVDRRHRQDPWGRFLERVRGFLLVPYVMRHSLYPGHPFEPDTDDGYLREQLDFGSLEVNTGTGMYSVRRVPGPFNLWSIVLMVRLDAGVHKQTGKKSTTSTALVTNRQYRGFLKAQAIHLLASTNASTIMGLTPDVANLAELTDLVEVDSDDDDDSDVVDLTTDIV